MTTKNESFADHLLQLKDWYDLPTLFADFTTLISCALDQDPCTGLPRNDELYESILFKYSQRFPVLNFPAALGALLQEAAAQQNDPLGNDLLCEFYKEHICPHGERPSKKPLRSKKLKQPSMAAFPFRNKLIHKCNLHAEC